VSSLVGTIFAAALDAACRTASALSVAAFDFCGYENVSD
jgi:hypothetical protein